MDPFLHTIAKRGLHHAHLASVRGQSELEDQIAERRGSASWMTTERLRRESTSEVVRLSQ